MKNKNEVLNLFKVEELEKRYEMGWIRVVAGGGTGEGVGTDLGTGETGVPIGEDIGQPKEVEPKETDGNQ